MNELRSNPSKQALSNVGESNYDSKYSGTYKDNGSEDVSMSNYNSNVGGKKKYRLQDGDEVLEYYIDVEGKRKKKIRRTAFEKRKLTKEEVSEIKHAFSLFDKDGSESIDVAELKDAMKALGIHFDKNQIKQLMEKADKDGSGSIDLKEFTSLMAEKISTRDT